MTWRRRLALAILIAAVPAVARGQCPDGSPPPCTPRRADPPLDDRTWIVVPFNNATRTPDIDWLRDGSVNLLYLDMSRWRDIHVVDDKRVADFVRDLPSVRARQPLSLNDAISVARRAGAGKLVMGDLFRTGSRTAVAATVYDVRRGERLRTIRSETAVPDSLIPLFEGMAHRILSLPALAANRGAGIGTTRVDAYQEYLLGTQALNRFDVALAKKHLQRALQLDSSFALAHYRLAIAAVYDEAAQAEQMRQFAIQPATARPGLDDFGRLKHATEASRLSAGLPERERGLIGGLLALTREEYARACAAYGALARNDSSDVEALFGLGECLRRDDVIEAIGGDTTQLRFRGDWNAAVRVLRRALVVDPAFHLAFDAIFTMLSQPFRMGCRPVEAVPCKVNRAELAAMRSARDVPRYWTIVKVQGDSFIATPRPLMAAMREFAEDQRGVVIPRENLERARVLAQEWVEAGPRESRAHRSFGSVLLALGRVAEADSQFAQATEPAADFITAGLNRIEIALKLDRAAEVNRLVDSMTRHAPGFTRIAFEAVKPVLGRMSGIDSAHAMLRWLLAQQPATRISPLRRPEMDSLFILQYHYGRHCVRAMFGITPDSAIAAERVFLARSTAESPTGACGRACAAMIMPTLALGLRLRRDEWPRFDETVKDVRLAPAVALARGNLPGLRTAAHALDSIAKDRLEKRLPDDGSAAVAAEAYLQLGDSAAAYAAIGRILDHMMFTPTQGMPLFAGSAGPSSVALLWPRAMLMRAELAAARREHPEARRWYKRFLDLWASAEPDAQPVVERARRGYLAVGGS